MADFNLNSQYQAYLKMVGLEESRMIPIQRIETKRAFMAGCGQMLVLMRDEVSQLTEDNAVEALESMFYQTEDFWSKELVNQEINKIYPNH